MVGTRKILVVRVGRTGDLIMITPALRALLDAFPEAECHLLTGPEGARVLQGFDPRLTRTWTLGRRFPDSLTGRRPLSRAFFAEGYEHVYVFETSPRYRRWLGSVARRYHGLGPDTPGVHYSDRCLEVVAASLGAPVARGWAHLPVAVAGREAARSLLREHGVEPQDLLVGLHPTFSDSGSLFRRDREGRRHRRWPPESFGRLAVLLRDRAAAEGRRLHVVVDALPGERRLVEPVVEAADGAVTLLCAPPDFERYKGLLAGLNALVTPNTGPMHVAAAVGTPLVALFSRWSAAECGPYMDPARYEVLRAEDAPRPGLGLAAIAPEVVAASAWRMLAKRFAASGPGSPR